MAMLCPSPYVGAGGVQWDGQGGEGGEGGEGGQSSEGFEGGTTPLCSRTLPARDCRAEADSTIATGKKSCWNSSCGISMSMRPFAP